MKIYFSIVSFLLFANCTFGSDTSSAKGSSSSSVSDKFSAKSFEKQSDTKYSKYINKVYKYPKILKNIAYLSLRQMCYRCGIDETSDKDMAKKLAKFLNKNKKNIFLATGNGSIETIIGLPYIAANFWKKETELLVLVSTLLEVKALELAAAVKDSRTSLFGVGKRAELNEDQSFPMYYPLTLYTIHASMHELIKVTRESAKTIINLAEKNSANSESIRRVKNILFKDDTTESYIKRSFGKYEKAYKEHYDEETKLSRKKLDFEVLKKEILDNEIQQIFEAFKIIMPLTAETEEEIKQIFCFGPTLLGEMVIKMDKISDEMKKRSIKAEDDILAREAMNIINRKMNTNSQNTTLASVVESLTKEIDHKNRITLIKKLLEDIVIFPFIEGLPYAYENFVKQTKEEYTNGLKQVNNISNKKDIKNRDGYETVMRRHAKFISTIAFILAAKSSSLARCVIGKEALIAQNGATIHPLVLLSKEEDILQKIKSSSDKLMKTSVGMYRSANLNQNEMDEVLKLQQVIEAMNNQKIKVNNNVKLVELTKKYMPQEVRSIGKNFLSTVDSIFGSIDRWAN